MKAKKLNITTMDGLSGEQSVDLSFETMSSGISRRDFLTVSLAAAALLALTGCATIQSSKNDFDQATTDLRNLLDGFEGDGARQARLASIGRRIENRCREVIELKSDFTQKLHALSRRRETPSSELTALVEDFSVRRVKYREELFGVQDELRQALTKAEWDQAVEVLNSGADAFSRTRL